MEREKKRKKRISFSSKYKSDTFPKRVYKLCLLGLTNDELAIAFGVSVASIEKWQVKYETFGESVKRGRREADSNVVRAMYQRAIGYSHPDTHISVWRGEVISVPITKYYPPDTGAGIFWLKNRTRNNKYPFTNTDRVELTGRDGGDIEIKNISTLDMKKFSKEELILMANMTDKIYEKSKLDKKKK